jgi:hypothetical protein
MGGVLRAYGRAFLSQWHGKVLLLSLLPFLLAGALWAVLLYVGLQPMIDYVQALFQQYDGFRYSSSLLASLGLSAVKTIVVPLIAILLLLPLMILTSLIFMGVAAMPAITRHIGRRHYGELELRKGGSLWGSLSTALGSSLLFLLLWILTLPLYAWPPLAVAAHVVLWGWLSCKVMVYDVLADYASAEERAVLAHSHRWPLLVIGIISGLAGAVPGIVWLAGTAMTIALFPFLAALSIWLYVVIFIFTGLWFTYYCLEALARERAQRALQEVQ